MGQCCRNMPLRCTVDDRKKDIQNGSNRKTMDHCEEIPSFAYKKWAAGSYEHRVPCTNNDDLVFNQRSEVAKINYHGGKAASCQ